MKLTLISVCVAALTVTPLGGGLDKERGNAIRLREAVEVNHPIVLLADLLPADAPAPIRKEAAALELCRAPQPGSVRILREEQILASITRHTDLARRLVMPPQVTIRYSSWPIKEASVRDAISEFLHKHGSNAALPDAARLDLPEFASAREENCELQVTQLQWDRPRQAIEVRLRCSKRWSCSSFVAHVVLPKSLPEEWLSSLLRTMAIPEKTAPDATQPPLVARGKGATLILEDAMMRISVPVICLEPGLLNQRIRVFDKHSRRVFLAKVVGDHLLHASL